MLKRPMTLALTLCLVTTSFLTASSFVSTQKAEAQCETNLLAPSAWGLAFSILSCLGQVAWVGYNTYSVDTYQLSSAFSKAYGYCPLDADKLGNDYASKNRSRYWGRVGNRMFFVRN